MKEMTTLCSISLDILAEITVLLRGSSVLRLWLTGDLNLQIRLRKGGIKELQFEDRTKYSTSRWPMMIGELEGLEKLSLLRDGRPLASPALLWRELCRLRSLVTLNFFVSDSLSVLECGRTHEVLKLGEIFPKMLRFNFGHLRLDAMPSWVQLPPKLEAFGMLYHTALNASEWPSVHEWSKITSLKIMWGNRSRIADQSIPFHTYCPHLEAYYIYVVDITDEWLTSLPHSITEMTVMSRHLTTRQRPFSALLPSQIVELDIHAFQILTPIEFDLAEHQKLKFLKISSPLPCTFPLILLPPQLQSVHISAPVAAGCHIFLTPNLTYFKYVDLSQSSPIIATWDPSGPIDPTTRHPAKFTSNQWPKGLKSLQFSGTERKDETSIFQLWQSAIRLSPLKRLKWASYGPKKSIPREITKDIETITPKLEVFDFSDLFDFASIARFSQLQSLNARISREDSKYISVIPATVRSLNLEIIGDLEEIDLSRLPQYLQSFTFGAIDGWNLKYQNWRDIASLTQLTSIELNCAPKLDPMIRDSDVAFLPDSLTGLEIDSVQCNFTSKCFQHLPRELRKLAITSITIIDQSDFLDLPRGIRVCSTLPDTHSCPTTLPPANEFALNNNKALEEDEFYHLHPDPRTPTMGFICQPPRAHVNSNL